MVSLPRVTSTRHCVENGRGNPSDNTDVTSGGHGGRSGRVHAHDNRAFSSESLPRTRSGVGAGSRQENASNIEIEPPFRFNRNGKGTSTDGALPDGVTAWSSSCPEQRFAVYRNNVATGLIGALASRFPVTEKIVGKAF